MPRHKHLHVVHTDAPACERTAEEAIFDHWAFMLHKRPSVIALGPSRLKAIRAALALYDAAVLRLAIDGCAASAWHRGENDRHREYTDLTLILRDEAHIERFAAEGEALHERAAALARRAAADVVPVAAPVVDAAQVAADRARLRALASKLAGRRVAAEDD